jgi:hypothetical protein
MYHFRKPCGTFGKPKMLRMRSDFTRNESVHVFPNTHASVILFLIYFREVFDLKLL